MYISYRREHNDVVIVALIADRCGPARYLITRSDFSPIKWVTVKLVRPRAGTVYAYGSAYVWQFNMVPCVETYRSKCGRQRGGDATVKRCRNDRCWNPGTRRRPHEFRPATKLFVENVKILSTVFCKSRKANVRLLIVNLAIHSVKYATLSREGSQFIIVFF